MLSGAAVYLDKVGEERDMLLLSLLLAVPAAAAAHLECPESSAATPAFCLPPDYKQHDRPDSEGLQGGNSIDFFSA